jgi:hypothetical protein
VLRLIVTELAVIGTRPAPARAGLASLNCLLRGLPLFFRASPKTPLRVLCIIALDTLHVLRRSRPLPRERKQQLATFLDFQACANAAWDGKPLCAVEYEALRQRLETAGLGSWIAEYLDRLRELEADQPPTGGGDEGFHDVREYREAVARLALATITAIALDAACVEEGIQATHADRNVATLFRLAMQCQIIDDVVDYRADLSAGLPSFLTASSSLPRALSLTAHAARSYASPGRASGHGVLPLRLAAHVVAAVATVVVRVAQRRLLGFDGP